MLITGAFGLVGCETVRRFAADGWQVVATSHRKAEGLPPGVQIRRVDLSEPDQVDAMVGEVAPDVIVHLAAVIPPLVYLDRALARRVNVDATAAVVRAAERQPNPPRLLHASSVAIYGSRNPHHCTDLLGVDTPIRPSELYGGHKAEAEHIVRSSTLDWVILRLGGVLSVDPSAMPFSKDIVYFGSAIPSDCRVHCVDTRDVATAFAAATHADVVGQILLIAGDDSLRLLHGEIGTAMAAAQGMVGILPQSRPGDPNNDDDWYLNDWMDVARAQELLGFQRHSWPDMLAEMRATTGWKRYPRRLVAPLVRQILKGQGAYRKSPGSYADVRTALRAGFGDTAMDTASAE